MMITLVVMILHFSRGDYFMSPDFEDTYFHKEIFLAYITNQNHYQYNFVFLKFFAVQRLQIFVLLMIN